jgi:hypothetical protein
MTASVRAVAWQRDGIFGAEFAEVTFAPNRLSAVGVALGADPLPYRLDYRLETRRGFVTRRLRVTTRGDGWRRTLDLSRAPSGAWQIDTDTEGEAPLPPAGGDVAPLAGALDCDLGLSPLTNSLPVLRENFLGPGGPLELLMAWVSVPDLGVHPSRQRYTLQRAGDGGLSVVRYESVGGTFTADLTFDRDGLVVDYPGLARRLP